MPKNVAFSNYIIYYIRFLSFYEELSVDGWRWCVELGNFIKGNRLFQF